MQSILILAAAVILAASPSTTAPSPNAGSDAQQVEPADGRVVVSSTPTLICGALVAVDKKTYEDLHAHSQPESDSCTVSPRALDSTFDVDEPSNIA